MTLQYDDTLETQPREVYCNDEFLVIRQWDATGEMEHCVLVPLDDIEGLLLDINRALVDA